MGSRGVEDASKLMLKTMTKMAKIVFPRKATPEPYPAQHSDQPLVIAATLSTSGRIPVVFRATTPTAGHPST